MLKQSLESGKSKEPDLNEIINELEQAQSDNTHYLNRLEHCRKWWHSQWKSQHFDGRKHAEGEQDVVTPWEGASDSRLRIVDTLIDDHVSICKAAFWGARVSVRSQRPLVFGRVANIAQKILDWHVYTQMRLEVNRELWFGWSWKYGFGLSFMGIEWEQQRSITHERLTLESLAQIAQQLGLPELMQIESATDQEQKDSDAPLIEFLQQLSPILAKDEARKILYELRNEGASSIPVIAYPVNKPKWTALMPCVDVIFPSETSEVQTARWISRRELVTEWELTDRIETDAYDPDFVEEALKHKGEFSDWMNNPGWRWAPTGSERDVIELHHFLWRSVESGIPMIYRTIFCAAVPKQYAVHRLFEYQHQLYPFVAMRRSYDFRPLLTSVGIAEEAYTDEMDIKAQQDGLTDRTELINSPPMIVPTLRAMGIRSQYGPRAVMSALRPNEVSWAPLPPSDDTPVRVIAMVQDRLDRRYAITGATVDPQMKIIRQQELANDTHGEIELILEQTLKLAQQFDTDEIVQKVAGNSNQPFNAGVEDMLGDHTISVTMDMRMTDTAYVKEKLEMFQAALGMNQAGTANMTKIFSRIMAIVDPDAEDLVEEDQQSATEKEIDDEDSAAAKILVGMEPRKPQFGNHQLRLQRLVEQTLQNPNPYVQETIQKRKDVQKLLKNRIEFHRNQIQQYQLNPQIGRSLSTKTFQPQQPAEMQTLQ